MKRYVGLLFVIVLLILPKNGEAKSGEYKVVSELPEANITLYAQRKNGQFQDFKIYFKRET